MDSKNNCVMQSLLHFIETHNSFQWDSEGGGAVVEIKATSNTSEEKWNHLHIKCNLYFFSPKCFFSKGTEIETQDI